MTWLSDRALERLRETADSAEPVQTRYAVLEEIGRGGMSAVYRARDRMLDRDVALKVLDEPLASPALAARLGAEARVLARLEHPSIVPVHDLGVLPDGRPYYVMKLVRGRDLGDAAAAESSLHGRLRLFERICEAVAFAHARGVIHRDLKPSNIMVGAFGEVLVLDWGLAKLRQVTSDTGRSAAGATLQPPVVKRQSSVDERPAGPAPAEGSRDRAAGTPLTAKGMVLGTPGYMAPEQLAGEPVDERTDVYALGVLLAWLLGVHGPAAAAPAAEAAPAVSAGEPTAPRPLCAIANRACAELPSDRYASVAELVADVRRYLDGLAVSAHREGALDRVGRFARRHRVAIALVAAYLLMRILLLAWAGV
jgi:eukaryotic-like serine/threonine-protein kinase